MSVLTDWQCESVIEEMRTMGIDGPLTYGHVRRVYKTLKLIVKPTGQYALFAFADYFRKHPPDAVSLLGEVVADDP